MTDFPTNHIFIGGDLVPEKADTLGVMNFSAALYTRLKDIRDMKEVLDLEKHWHLDKVSMKKLKTRLRLAINTGDMVEVGCVAMMIYNRKQNNEVPDKYTTN